MVLGMLSRQSIPRYRRQSMAVYLRWPVVTATTKAIYHTRDVHYPSRSMMTIMTIDIKIPYNKLFLGVVRVTNKYHPQREFSFECSALLCADVTSSTMVMESDTCQFHCSDLSHAFDW